MYYIVYLNSIQSTNIYNSSHCTERNTYFLNAFIRSYSYMSSKKFSIVLENVVFSLGELTYQEMGSFSLFMSRMKEKRCRQQLGFPAFSMFIFQYFSQEAGTSFWMLQVGMVFSKRSPRKVN